MIHNEPNFPLIVPKGEHVDLVWAKKARLMPNLKYFICTIFPVMIAISIKSGYCSFYLEISSKGNYTASQTFKDNFPLRMVCLFTVVLKRKTPKTKPEDQRPPYQSKVHTPVY